jgi:DNA-binding winged helix-turn-helix (wHTH) protein
MGDEAGCDAIYKFGQFCLDAGGSTLTKRGKKVRLNARPMEVLLYRRA